jgi:exodeoxyribonuclease V alpha subunit
MRSNGDEAEILEYDGKNVTIKYSGPSDKPETIDVTSLYDNFILNYAITVHKSQGSQYSKVIFMIDQNQNLTDKNTIYTAISRAKEKCIVVSNNDKFIKLQCPKNDGSDNKVSLFMEESDIYEL